MERANDKIILEKKERRKKVLKIRDSIEDRNEDDLKIFNKLRELHIFKVAKNVFVYINFGSEINTKLLIENMLEDGKTVFVPKVKGRDMLAIKIESLANLVEGKYKILEPAEDKNNIDVDNLDLIIMPGVVFDRTGNRIGYGGGFYDRFLEGAKEKFNRVALAYSFQLVDKIDIEEHDLKVNYIITENEVIYI